MHGVSQAINSRANCSKPNFRELRVGELRRIPKRRSSQNTYSTHFGEDGCAVVARGISGSTAELDGPRAAVHRHRLPVAKPERRIPGPDYCGDAVLAGDEGGVGG